MSLPFGIHQNLYKEPWNFDAIQLPGIGPTPILNSNIVCQVSLFTVNYIIRGPRNHRHLN